MTTGPRAAQLAQFGRFALIGVVNTGTFYLCYLPLHRWLPYFSAFTLAYLASMVGSFFLNTYFTYRTRPSWRKFAFFPLTQLTNYLAQSAGLYLLVSGAGLNSTTAPLLAAAGAVPFTYLVSRRILLPHPREEPAP
ncbi:hypothetical protein SUDANB171_03751 [Streptomyces sp. enrichment culture]|jgi:putative flippase GtrA|uniref:GtrA family protein n=1 Tax=Streptomyces xiamenensis TaxID=408015 RepID=UPI0036EF700D